MILQRLHIPFNLYWSYFNRIKQIKTHAELSTCTFQKETWNPLGSSILTSLLWNSFVAELECHNWGTTAIWQFMLSRVMKIQAWEFQRWLGVFVCVVVVRMVVVKKAYMPCTTPFRPLCEHGHSPTGIPCYPLVLYLSVHCFLQIPTQGTKCCKVVNEARNNWEVYIWRGQAKWRPWCQKNTSVPGRFN